MSLHPEIQAVLDGESKGCVVTGDCLEIMADMPDGCVDAVVTDPPYGIGLGQTAGAGGSHGLSLKGYNASQDTYDDFVAAIVPRINAAIDLAARAAVFTGPHIHEQRKPDAIGGIHCPAASGRHKWGFKSFLPLLLYGSAPELHLGGACTSIVSTATAKKNGHPVPKPLAWMIWVVGLASRTGDIICDPFCGSGTTCVAAKKLGRKFIGIEIDETYAEIARRRIASTPRPLFTEPVAKTPDATLFPEKAQQ